MFAGRCLVLLALCIPALASEYHRRRHGMDTGASPWHRRRGSNYMNQWADALRQKLAEGFEKFEGPFAPGPSGSAAVPVVTLNNQVEMPMISFGTWQYNADVAEAAVKTAMGVGFNHIDTANNYYNQRGVGKALAGLNRSSYFLTTKVPSADRASTAYSETARRLQEDLDQLGLDYVDLMLLHFPSRSNDCAALREQWRAMEDFYKARRARAIGVSNYCVASFECLKSGNATVVPAVNQVKYHVGMGPDPEGIKSYCASIGVTLQSYSPLGDGTSDLLTGSLVTSIGGTHANTGPQAALRWIVENGVPLSTKSTSEEHLRQDLDIFSWALSAEEKATLDAATQPGGRPSFMCTSAGSAWQAVVV